jgi:hypothetical protein
MLRHAIKICDSLFFFPKALLALGVLSAYTVESVMVLSRFGITIDGVWIGKWIYLPLIHTTWHYNSSAIVNLHTLQINTALAKLFPACSIFSSRSLATASNRVDSSSSCSQVLSSQPPVQNSCTPGQSQSQSYVTTDGQSASLSWCQAPIWDLRPDFFFLSDSCGFAGRPNCLQDNSSARTTQKTPAPRIPPLLRAYCCSYHVISTQPIWALPAA